MNRFDLRVGNLDFVNAQVERLTIAHIKSAYDFTEKYYDTKYKPLFRIYNMQSPERWDRLQKWGDVEDFKEYKLLTNAIKSCRTALNSNARPLMFKKTKVAAYIRKLDKDAKHKQGQSEKKQKVRRTGRDEGLNATV